MRNTDPNLSDPSLIRHYEDWPRDQDWRPMIRAVEFLRARPYAPMITAWTSHEVLVMNISTSAHLPQCGYVSVRWLPNQRQFELRLALAGSPNIVRRCECEEAEFPQVVDSMVQALMMSIPPNGHLRANAVPEP